MCISLWLSQYKTGSLVHVMCNSFMRVINQSNSHVANDNARYSASEDDLEMVFCFFARHDIREVPRKKQYPEMDFLESIHHAQSELEKPSSCNSASLRNKIPLPGLFFRYRISASSMIMCHCWIVKKLTELLSGIRNVRTCCVEV